MKYFEEYIDTGEVKAETLVSQMEIPEDFGLRWNGIFFRNYSDDLMNVKEEDNKTVIELSRDGIFQLLPEGLFFDENHLKKKNKGYDFKKEQTEIEKLKKSMMSFFNPFDAHYFDLNIGMEKVLNNISQGGNSLFIKAFESELEINTDNEYILKLKKILPFASYLRGNLTLLIDILKNIFSVEKIEIRKIKPLFLRFIVHKGGLTKEEFLSMDEKSSAFFDFFSQWFLPVEIEYDYKIKSYKDTFKLGNTLILDYNTYL